MVLFGAPVSMEDHATSAVRAGLAMVQAVNSNARVWEQHHFPALRIGVGVHSGPAVIGAIGSGVRKDYTANGDTINTASRVEGETKQHGVEVLITAATFQRLARFPELRARCQAIAEPVSLKGKAEVMQLYQVQ